MNALRTLLHRIGRLFSHRKIESELDEEMSFHLEQSIERNVERGMSPDQARREALIAFGGMEQTKEYCRDSWGTRAVTDLFRDLRYAATSLRRVPGLSLTIIATLALCMAANTTVFSVLNKLVLNPLPFKDSQNLVHIFNLTSEVSTPYSLAAWTQYRDFKEQADLFENFALVSPQMKISGESELSGLAVSSDFFNLLQVQPLLGRFFALEESDPGPGQVMVITQSAWENDYGADPDIIGKEVRFLNENTYIIVGVAPRITEAFDSQLRFFIPRGISARERNPQRRYTGGTHLWGRIKSGISHEEAMAQLEIIEARWHQANPGRYLRRAAFDSSAQHFTFGRPNPIKTHLILLQGGAFLVLLIGCVNVLNLLLSRASQRCHELSVRLSLGAERFALTRLMLSESILLAVVGALVGSALTWLGLLAVNRYLVVLAPNAPSMTLDGTVIVWTLVISGVVALIMGLLPIRILWRSGRIMQVSSSARTSSSSGGARKLSGSLVVMQVSMTFALIIGAGLLLQSYRNVLSVDPGFDASRVVTGSMSINRIYQLPDRVAARQRILESMREIPGVEGVNYISSDSIGKHLQVDPIWIAGDSAQTEEEAPTALVRHVGREFFSTMGIPITEGRDFRSGDMDPPIGQEVKRTSYIVDTEFGRRYLPDSSVIDSEMSWNGHRSPQGEHHFMPVVGVAGRANFEGLEARDGLPVIYSYTEQIPFPRFNLLVRTTRDPATVIREIRGKLKEVHPSLHLYGATSLAVPYGNLNLGRQGTTLMLGTFAGLALFLSAIGIYGVLAYDVQQRTREIGIRGALGASPSGVLLMVLRQGMGKAVIGLVLGVAGAIILTRYLQSMLFDISSLDPVTYLIGGTGLLSVAALASFLPSRRAAKVDPMIALRCE
ncbi:MAG: ADOP family duplicated permease [Akkermansiaceae bacterium]